MRRREFTTLLGGAAIAWPMAARAQQATARLRRIGIMMPYVEGDAELQARVRALQQELARLGWTGSNAQFDERWTTDDLDQVRANAVSLVASNPDVIVALGGRVVPILLQLSRSIPIVLPSSIDPVGIGWAKSLARPGGNVTGFAAFELSMFGKTLEILKQIAPAITRVGLIYNPDNPSSVVFRRTIEPFAGRLGVEPVDLPIRGLPNLEGAVARLADRPNVGVFFLPDITISTLGAKVIPVVERHKLPAMYSDAIFVKSGGLAFYGADRLELFRRAAGYVDRILRGEKAGELPIQQPTKYELMLNLKAAKALGLTMPPGLLVAADEVIE